MALASLCSQLSENDPRFLPFKAYIVDHRFRSGSREEALSVKSNLDELGARYSLNIIFIC